MIEPTQTEKEVNFLKACGFNISNGYISEDVDFYKNKEYELYLEYVVNY
jgi:hypothetical protein